MPRLRIVRCADYVATQIFAKNLGITALHAARHRLSDEREGLMTIEAAQLNDLSVQFKPMISELCFTETQGASVVIQNAAFVQQTNAHLI